MKRLICGILTLLMLLTPIAHMEAETDAERAARLEGELASALETIEELRAQLDAYEASEKFLEQFDAYQNAQVIASYDGGVILFEDVRREYEEIAEIYSLFYEGDLDDNTDQVREIQENIVYDMVVSAVINNRLERNGVTLLTDEETQRALDEAARAYAQLVDENAVYALLEGATDEDAQAQAQEFLAEIGSDPEALAELYLDDARTNALFLHVAGEIELTDEYIEQIYNEQLASDQAYYSLYPGEYAYEALYGSSLVTWIPEGYRRVCALLIPFDEEALEAADELFMQAEEAEDVNGIQLQLDELYAALMPKADDALNRLRAGEDFENLMAEYPASFMLGLDGRAEFAIAENSLYFSPEIEQAAMALSEPGDVSAPVKADGGLMLIKYVSDVKSGAIPLEEIIDKVREYAYEVRLYDQYETTLTKWLEEANVEYFFERLN